MYNYPQESLDIVWVTNLTAFVGLELTMIKQCQSFVNSRPNCSIANDGIVRRINLSYGFIFAYELYGVIDVL